ncbi:inositol-3-phosphate synthase [Sorangium sp. So ce590]|uniref:inositol-3-phosphate synthase n=1 Tax=Sorangium sp. So ce590 TaxID=3133317 RepID=UPI003F636E77
MYAWACLEEGVPFANGAPNPTVDFPAAWEPAATAPARGGSDISSGSRPLLGRDPLCGPLSRPTGERRASAGTARLLSRSS